MKTMTSARISILLSLAAICICAWLYVATLHAEAATQTQLTEISRKLADIQDMSAAQDVRRTAADTGNTETLTRAVTAAVLNKLKNRLPALGHSDSGEQAIPAVSTEAQRGAADQAEQILQSAMSSGILTRAEVLQMRELKLRSGGGPAFDDLTQEIFQALNQKKLVAEDPAMVVP